MQAAEERRKRLKLMRESGAAQEDAEPAATPLSGDLPEWVHLLLLSSDSLHYLTNFRAYCA